MADKTRPDRKTRVKSEAHWEMPEKRAKKEAMRRKRQGKSPSSQAGEFVHQEIRHVREGKHGARSPQQAIAIGLSKARRAGVKVPAQKRGSARTRRNAAAANRAGRHPHRVSATRSRGTARALRRERHDTASRGALARQARSASRRRGPAARSRAARKAARTRSRRG